MQQQIDMTRGLKNHNLSNCNLHFCGPVTILLLLQYCISTDMLRDHCMLITITGNTMDANNYHSTMIINLE